MVSHALHNEMFTKLAIVYLNTQLVKYVQLNNYIHTNSISEDKYCVFRILSNPDLCGVLRCLFTYPLWQELLSDMHWISDKKETIDR